MRIGKFVEHFRAASELYDAAMKSGSGDKIVQYLQILRQLGYGGYMFTDMLTVPDAMGVKKFASAKRLQSSAYRFWLLGLVSSALAGVYANYRLSTRVKEINEKDAEGKLEKAKIAKYVKSGNIPAVHRLTNFLRQQAATNIQLLSDLCDLTVPSSALGYVDLDDGIVGLAGTVSSILGVQGVWAKTG